MLLARWSAALKTLSAVPWFSFDLIAGGTAEPLEARFYSHLLGGAASLAQAGIRFFVQLGTC